MKALSGIFLCLTLTVAYGSLCTDLSGTWQNQLNSNMTIENITDNSFTGVYHTAVESTTGAARLSSKISGMIQNAGDGKLIGFNVLWNRGASLTAWVGQCIVCDGKEKIFTTWVLRSYLPDRKRWMTTRVNQDTFWRPENAGHDETEYLTNQAISSAVSENAPSNWDILGKWVSTSRDSFDIKEVQEFGTWNGIHQEDGEDEAFAVGRYDGNLTYTAVGFVATKPDKVRGYTGHIDNFRRSRIRVLETSWLEHTFHQSCNAPRKYVHFGIDNFYKSEVTGLENQEVN